MFCKLDSSKLEQYNRYWSDKIDVSTEDGVKAYEKIKPIADKDGNYYVIKSFATDSDGKPHNPTTLPYKLIRARGTIDSWSVGVILYSMISGDNGKALFKVDNKDDLDENDFITLATWTQEKITRTIKKHSVFYEIVDSDCNLIRMSSGAWMMLSLQM